MKIELPAATVNVKKIKSDKRQVVVRPKDPNLFVPISNCITSYGPQLIKHILEVKGPAWLCDEILRDEDPEYIAHHIKTTLFAHLPQEEFYEKRLLDFGAGSGASTMVLGNFLPRTAIVGVELNPEFISIAKERAKHYGFDQIKFVQSPNEDTLPENLGKFDFIFLSAVYEHLRPLERERLLPQFWKLLNPKGVLFIDETPYRWLPIETHTTGLPFINYLPDKLALQYARYFSRRNLRLDDWPALLRKGVRGTTPKDVLNQLCYIGAKAKLVSPIGKFYDQVDVWFEGYARIAVGRSGQLKRGIRWILKLMYKITGKAFVPYLSLAIKKEK